MDDEKLYDYYTTYKYLCKTYKENGLDEDMDWENHMKTLQKKQEDDIMGF